MNKKILNKTFLLGGDLKINRIGFGAMRITGPEVWGMPENPQNSIDILRRAVELGVNFIDTADQYGPFVSEELIAEALHPYKESLIVGTKGGLVRFGPWTAINHDASPQHLQDALDGSLRRLKLDCIDLYQLHRIDPKVPTEKSFEFLQKAQASGKIKHIGLSEVSVIEIELARKFFNVVSVQNKYSIDNRSWEPVLEYCEQNNIAFIPWFPVGGGSVKDQEILRQMAERKNTSIHLLALSWLLHHSNNIILIPGTSSLSHLQENMKVADIQLSEEELKELDGLSTLS